MDEHELEQLVSLAWDADASQAPGRRALTLEQITSEAIRLADAGGLVAASMPKLAEALGVGTMSLYRYVPSKTVLVHLMLDHATEAPPVPEAVPGWEEALMTYAAAAFERFRRHPWALDVPVVGFPQTPRVLAWLEYGLSALAGAGYGEQDQLGSMLLLDGHVSATARIRRSAELTAGASEPPLDRLEQAPYVQLAALVRRGALAEDEFGDYGYHYGVERIIDSIRNLHHSSVPSRTHGSSNRAAGGASEA